MNNSYITDYYNSYNEDERTKSRHGSVEFLTNMKYIRSYVPQGAKVLDVGAGTGVYSIALAMDGYDVHALELVEHNIEVFRSNLPEGANIPVEQFPIDRLTPGIAMFGLSFFTLFSATLISKDRASAFLTRLFSTPLSARDFILGTIIGNYSENATVLISTHLISDVERVLDDVIFLAYGKVGMTAAVDDIRENQGKSVDELFREVYRC